MQPPCWPFVFLLACRREFCPEYEMSRGNDPNPNGNLLRAGNVFATTHWSIVRRAGSAGTPAGAEALEALCRTYWTPLFNFVRSRGYDLEESQDLTQEFFVRLLEGNLVSAADQAKGKFRSFLLGALKNFLANEWDRSRAIKRGGHCFFIPWDQLSAESMRHSVELTVPAADESVYDRFWAMALLDKVFKRLQNECASAGKDELFQALHPFLSGERSRSDESAYVTVGGKVGLSAAAVQVAVHRLRKRYGQLLREEVAHTVNAPEEIDGEIRHLFTALRH